MTVLILTLILRASLTDFDVFFFVSCVLAFCFCIKISMVVGWYELDFI